MNSRRGQTASHITLRPSWDVEQGGGACSPAPAARRGTRSVTQRPSWDSEFEAREVPHRHGHRSVLVASQLDHDGIAYVATRPLRRPWLISWSSCEWTFRGTQERVRVAPAGSDASLAVPVKAA